MNVNFQSGIASNEFAESRKLDRNGEAGKNGKMQNGSVFLGNLNQTWDPVLARKEQIQNRAMQLWKDAVSAEQKIDLDLEERAAHIEKLHEDIDAANEQVKYFSGEQDALKEKYSIDEDSQEQQDLELLLKQRKARKPSNQPNMIEFSEEELERLKELEGQPLTEYQSRYLELEDAKGIYQDEINACNKECLKESKIITGIKLERLKSHALADAQEKKDEMMIAASEEAASMLMDEVKDKLDKDLEELEEKVEEKAEKEEAEEERLEAIREEKKEAEYEDKNDELFDALQSEGAVQLESTKEEVKQEVKKMMSEMKLLVEDLKGAAVDEQL